MPLIQASHDSFPYIEPTPTTSQKTAIAALIEAELPPSHTTTPHPSLPPLPESNFTPLMTLELERVERGEPMTGGIDLSRYEPPSEAAEDSLRAAFTSATFLDGRLTNLSLLGQEVGKNAWLVHNAQLEETLKGVETELMGLRTECEVVNKARKGAQKDVEAEMRRLEERWKKGVGRVLETELAAEMVRSEVLEKRRAGR